ncbi:MAG TPA: UdgX family uracil-DNA binding protein [Thermodesulfobacteriota bacterium]|nr:UdgX family uracil-DNA binding protein [Thermodesulfobacteriota bacterium]
MGLPATVLHENDFALLQPQGTAASLIPPNPTLESLKQAAAACRACPVWERATHMVFGEGPADARIVMVGEQPGYNEDREGRAFIGPAGRVFDRALRQADLDRSQVYISGVVKHFKWAGKGRLRLHKKPNAREIGACLPWLEAEIDLIRPDVLVALGATAAQALFGPEVRVRRDRGRLLPSRHAPKALITVHPAAVLRTFSDEERRQEMERLIEDLRTARSLLTGGNE